MTIVQQIRKKPRPTAGDYKLGVKIRCTHRPTARWPRSAPSPRRPCAPDTGTRRNRPGWPTPIGARPAAPCPPSLCRPCTTWWIADRRRTKTSYTSVRSVRSGWPWPTQERSKIKKNKNTVNVRNSEPKTAAVELFRDKLWFEPQSFGADNR